MNREFDTLYAMASTGKVKQWGIEVKLNDDGTASIIKKYGQLDGKLIVNEKIITKGKNLGKKNATTPLTQAIADAQSAWNSKKQILKVL